jgi:hypothetical protein
MTDKRKAQFYKTGFSYYTNYAPKDLKYILDRKFHAKILSA